MISDHHTIALIGSKGMLARMIKEKAPQHYKLHLFDLPAFDITDCDQVEGLFDRVKPGVVINCAAYTNVDGCETEQGLAMQVNGNAVGYLAEAARRADATLVHISTDYVFDGRKDSPYQEDDPTNPQSVYGASKLCGEEAILASGLLKYFIVRTSWLYGPGGNHFVETILRLAKEREELRIIHEQVGSPTYTGDLADAIFQLLALTDHRSPITDHRPYGLYHFSNDGQCSWYEFAKEIVHFASDAGIEMKVKNVVPIKTEEYPLPATRPAYSVFDKTRYKNATRQNIPQWQKSLEKYIVSRDEKAVTRDQ